MAEAALEAMIELGEAASTISKAGEVAAEAAEGFEFLDAAGSATGKSIPQVFRVGEAAGQEAVLTAEDLNGVFEAASTSETFASDASQFVKAATTDGTKLVGADMEPVLEEANTTGEATAAEAVADDTLEKVSSTLSERFPTLTSALSACKNSPKTCLLGISLVTICGGAYITTTCTNAATSTVSTITRASDQKTITFVYTDPTYSSALKKAECSFGSEYNIALNDKVTISTGIQLENGSENYTGTFTVTKVDKANKSVTCVMDDTTNLINITIPGGSVKVQTSFSNQVPSVAGNILGDLASALNGLTGGILDGILDWIKSHLVTILIFVAIGIVGLIIITKIV